MRGRAGHAGARTLSVTVASMNGQWAPCRVVEPGGWATFSGYGPSGNHVVGLRTCAPAIVPAGDVRASDMTGRVDASAAVGWHLGQLDRRPRAMPPLTGRC
ncbi:hypothetical protein ABZZ44_33755 [Streptomyces sp. NPDC006460]|uniref:hypothetical protein n=1 Tax=Streptomyces sp. NPDC006460 TaxID=3154304 RepID=UPI0033B19BF8